MANVDKCVRECEEAICNDLHKHADNISRIPSNEQLLIFRDKNTEKIEMILKNCKETLQNHIIYKFYDNKLPIAKIIFKPSSNNNKEGADVLHILPNGRIIDIEIKFGNATDKAIGMAQFADMFGTEIFSDILNVNERKKWVYDYVGNKNNAAQIYNLSQILNNAIIDFNNFNKTKSYILTNSEQLKLESVLINNSGDARRISDYYLKFKIDKDNLREVKEIPIGIGSWVIGEVKQLDISNKRVNIFLTNRTTNVHIKLTLNWKKSYKISSIGKVPAKLGFGSQSWNVWEDVEIRGIL